MAACIDFKSQETWCPLYCSQFVFHIDLEGDQRRYNNVKVTGAAPQTPWPPSDKTNGSPSQGVTRKGRGVASSLRPPTTRKTSITFPAPPRLWSGSKVSSEDVWPASRGRDMDLIRNYYLLWRWNDSGQTLRINSLQILRKHMYSCRALDSRGLNIRCTAKKNTPRQTKNRWCGPVQFTTRHGFCVAPAAPSALSSKEW